MTDYPLLHFRKIWKLSPRTQVLMIVGLYVSMIVLGYFEYQKTGLIQGFPLKTSIFFVPIYEEIIFRGIILGILIKKMSDKKAIVVSSLLFGLWHFKNIFYMDLGDWMYQVMYTTLFFGPLMAYIALKTKTIWLGVILHYANNILAPLSFLTLGYLIKMN